MSRNNIFASLLIAMILSANTTSIGCDCFEDTQGNYGNQVHGIGLAGQEKTYSKRALLTTSWASDILTPFAFLPATISILSPNIALASLCVNTGLTLTSTFGGFLEPQKDMQRIVLKIGITTAMLGATIASTYAWTNFPTTLMPIIINGTITPIDPVMDLYFSKSYVTNVVFTTFATALSIPNLAVYCCRRLSQQSRINSLNPTGEGEALVQ